MMNNICVKTEDPSKYVSVYLLNEDWLVVLGDNNLRLANNTTKQTCVVLDITENNAKIFLTEENTPSDWTSGAYYYYPEKNVWERIVYSEE